MKQTDREAMKKALINYKISGAILVACFLFTLALSIMDIIEGDLFRVIPILRLMTAALLAFSTYITLAAPGRIKRICQAVEDGERSIPDIASKSKNSQRYVEGALGWMIKERVFPGASVDKKSEKLVFEDTNL